jgi:FixJ family two-component response regulator
VFATGTSNTHIPHEASFFKIRDDVGTKGGPLSASDCDSIWLLDDDVSMLKALGRLLSSAGLIAEKFSDPKTFLARLKHATCRVAILDVWMPEMNGLEVQAQLRRDSPKTRVIFITGRDDPSVRQTALEAGAFAFLTKPCEDEMLVQLVQKAMSS